jgi:hypothetical protein
VFEVERYTVEVERLLAAGGFANVYLARDINSEKRYALKKVSTNVWWSCSTMLCSADVLCCVQLLPHLKCFTEHLCQLHPQQFFCCRNHTIHLSYCSRLSSLDLDARERTHLSPPRPPSPSARLAPRSLLCLTCSPRLWSPDSGPGQ